MRYYREPDAAERQREPSEDERGLCLPPVRGLGTQWIGTKGALDSARKDWMERVRYDHGESFLDMSHAVSAASRCGRVSIGSFLGRVMYRCEFIARPCKAEFVQGEATKLASTAPSAPALKLPPPATAPAPPPTMAAAPLPQAQTSPPKSAMRLSFLKLFKHPLRRHQDRAAPAVPASAPAAAVSNPVAAASARAADKTPPSVQVAARFIGSIVLGAFTTMDAAPASAIAFAHTLLDAAFEFPIIYRALATDVATAD